MVFADVLCQTGQLVPMRHEGVFSAHAGMVVVDVFANQFQRLVAPMKLDAAVQIASHASQSLQPAQEARLELSARGHDNLYAT